LARGEKSVTIIAYSSRTTSLLPPWRREDKANTPSNDVNALPPSAHLLQRLAKLSSSACTASWVQPSQSRLFLRRKRTGILREARSGARERSKRRQRSKRAMREVARTAKRQQRSASVSAEPRRSWRNSTSKRGLRSNERCDSLRFHPCKREMMRRSERWRAGGRARAAERGGETAGARTGKESERAEEAREGVAQTDEDWPAGNALQGSARPGAVDW